MDNKPIPGAETIDVTPDGLLITAYNVVARLEQMGMIRYTKTNTEGAYALEVFVGLTANANHIAKSSWIRASEGKRGGDE